MNFRRLQIVQSFCKPSNYYIMKKLILFGFVALSLSFFGCEDFENTATPSAVTYLPKIDMNGNRYIELPCGTTSFDDPGVIATEEGLEINVDTKLTSAYFGGASIASPDMYTISYSATNVDGIPGSAFRTVIVNPCPTNLAENLEGKYVAKIIRDTGEEREGQYVFIVRQSSNSYILSDGVGGFYDFGRGYGTDYASKGATITVNDIGANDYTITDAQFPVWGNMVSITDFTVDPATETISYTGTGDWGSQFFITLTLVR